MVDTIVVAVFMHSNLKKDHLWRAKYPQPAQMSGEDGS